MVEFVAAQEDKRSGEDAAAAEAEANVSATVVELRQAVEAAVERGAPVSRSLADPRPET